MNRLEVYFTDWQESVDATGYWVSGVASSGTFIAPGELPLVESASKVPLHWLKRVLGSKDAPWKVGTIGPEVVAWTNGLGEIIFEGAGTVDRLSTRIPSLAAVAAGVDEITVKPGVTNAVANAYAGFGAPADPVELNALPGDWAGDGADPETGRWYAAYTKSAVQKELEEAIEPNGTVKPVPDEDGNPTNYVITITENIVPGPVVIPDDVGDVIIDLAGHTVSGTNGVDGTTATPGVDGGPAIVLGDNVSVRIVDSIGGGVAVGGKGGDGYPGGAGGTPVADKDGNPSAAFVADPEELVQVGEDGLTTKSPEQLELERAFAPNATVEPLMDETTRLPTNYVVTVTNDITGPVEVEEPVTAFIIDLEGHTITGTNGVDGTEKTYAMPGGPAVIVPEGTKVGVEDLAGGGKIIGGKGGNGNPAGDGGYPIAEKDGDRADYSSSPAELARDGETGTALGVMTAEILKLKPFTPWGGNIQVTYEVFGLRPGVKYNVEFMVTVKGETKSPAPDTDVENGVHMRIVDGDALFGPNLIDANAHMHIELVPVAELE